MFKIGDRVRIKESALKYGVKEKYIGKEAIVKQIYIENIDVYNVENDYYISVRECDIELVTSSEKPVNYYGGEFKPGDKVIIKENCENYKDMAVPSVIIKENLSDIDAEKYLVIDFLGYEFVVNASCLEKDTSSPSNKKLNLDNLSELISREEWEKKVIGIRREALGKEIIKRVQCNCKIPQEWIDEWNGVKND